MLAPIGPIASCIARNRASDTAVLAAPMSENETNRRPKSFAERRRAPANRGRRDRRPVANRHAMRAVPFRSPSAVDTHVDAAVGVVDPVDRHLVDAQAVALREEQQLGVEEPAVVLDRGQESPRDARPHRLEPALRVAHARREHRAQDQVVACGR